MANGLDGTYVYQHTATGCFRQIMGSLTRGGVFVPALSQPMTRGFERPMVGATPIEEGMPQKTSRKKLLMMRNGTPPDVHLYRFVVRGVK